MSSVLLAASGLTKRFGGLTAANDVSISLQRDRIHAVIGPNGAGKSTLANLLSGDMAPTSGRITLGGRDVTGWPADAIARQGLARSFQKTNVFMPFTVWENLQMAARARDAQQPWNPLRWFQNATKSVAASQGSTYAIEQSGLKNKARQLAGNLSHGEQRQLEIGMALATQPQVLLLDEPLAGMGVAESETMVSLLQSLRKDHAMLLVEHDMDAVFALADALTVMVNGQVIASGAPAEVRANAMVQAAYLGEHEGELEGNLNVKGGGL